MGKVTNISEVRDLADLIELYAERDRNGDGLLGADEVSADEIKAGDKGGTSSATHDVKDGFLSPWEVAQMRGFKWEDVRSLRIENQIHRTAFPDIESLPEDISLKGFLFKKGTPLRFSSNGSVRESVLAEPRAIPDFSYNGKELQFPSGTTVRFSANGSLEQFILAQEMIIGKTRYPTGSHFFYNPLLQNLHITPPPGQRIISDGHRCSAASIRSSDKYRPDSVEKHTLAEDTSITLAIERRTGPDEISKVHIPGNSHIGSTRGRIHSLQLGRRTNLFGFDCPEGTLLEDTGGGTPNLVLSSKTAGIMKRGMEFSYIGISMSGNIEAFLAKDSIVQLGNLRVPFAKGYLRLSPLGSIESGSLSQDLMSPYSFKKIPAGSIVDFSHQETLIEATEECFHALFPRIRTEGTPITLGTIRALLDLSPQMLSELRGVKHLDHSQAETRHPGFANPLTMSITVDGFESTAIHEAAHIHHYTVQRKYAERIAAATRDLDPENPTDQAAVHALETSIMAESFDGRWNAISKRPFHFSLADLMHAGVNYLLHDSGKLCEPGRQNWSLISEIDLFFNCYQKVNIWEEVAVTTERASESPQSYRQIIDPNASYYKEHGERRPFADIYRAKLELLREYGFITEAKYREIVPPTPVHPSLAAFCQTVNCR